MSEKSFIAGKDMKPQGICPAIALCNPKYARNVSMVIRLASGYGVKQVWYSGDRVDPNDPAKNLVDPYTESDRTSRKPRLPREERMRGYKEVELRQYDYFFDHFPNATPVAIELRPGAIQLQDYEHPENPLYVFGPEDGSLDQVIARHCHHFVVIPTHHCLNLATAVSTVLWDRKLKRLWSGAESFVPMSDMLVSDR